MLASFINNPIIGLLWFLGLVVAITVHETAHAWTADRLGDPTARLMGRLTLNPIKHMDPLGTLFLLFAQFGWGKPVPVDVFNLRHPRRDGALISLAGPLTNLITASLLSIILHVFHSPSFSLLTVILTPILIMNVNLAIFNLIPIHPLDGFAIVGGLLPENAAKQWEQLKSIGLLMMIVLIFPLFGSSPVLSLIYPVIDVLTNFLLP